jgi:hypothetical protein
MKKALSLAMVLMVLVSMLWVSTGAAGAKGLISYVDGRYVWGKGIVFVFDASGYRNKDVKHASIFVASNFYDLHCTVDKEKENIVCVLGGSLTAYAGQTGVIYLAGQVFYVTIPDKPQPPETPVDVPLTCEEPEVLGASVLFTPSEGSPFTEFVPGDTLDEVESRADSWVDGEFIISHGPARTLECGLPPQ